MLSFFSTSTEAATIANLQAATNKLHEESHKYQAQIKELQAELAGLKGEGAGGDGGVVKAAQVKVEDVKSRRSSAGQTAGAEGESELDEAWNKVIELQKEVAVLEEERDQNKQKADAAAQAKISTLEQTIMDMEKELEAFKEAKVQEEAKAQLQVVDMGIKAVEVEESLAAVQTQLGEKEALCSHLQTQIKQKDDLIQTLQPFKAQAEQLQAQLAEKEVVIKKLEEDVVKLTADRKAQGLDLTSRDLLIANLQATLVSRESVMDYMQNSLAEMQNSPVWKAMNPGKQPMSPVAKKPPPTSTLDILTQRKQAELPSAYVPKVDPASLEVSLSPGADAPVDLNAASSLEATEPQPPVQAASPPEVEALKADWVKPEPEPVPAQPPQLQETVIKPVVELVSEPTIKITLSSDNLSAGGDVSVDLSVAKDADPQLAAIEAQFEDFAKIMAAEKLGPAVISGFKANYIKLCTGSTGMIPESSILPVKTLPHLDDIKAGSRATVDPSLLAQTACLKLNGGLGTSMGLEKAKSLLEVRNGMSFLDFIAKQILHLRKEHNCQIKFLLMNSFSTSDDTKLALAKYPELGAEEIMQNKVPKVNAETKAPAKHPSNPTLEWCPPGHGDVYAALAGNGTLERLLAQGTKYLFLSNSDNLGATLDLDVLTYFASQEDMPLMLEVCQRTESDKKGGHLALRKVDGAEGGLLLRESAQCSDDEKELYFEDITQHKYFNTNNMWLRLDKLKEQMELHGGHLPLPMIKNAKTIDPRDKSTTKVFQLETAMGAAVESFPGAGALVVPRTRFAPVKTCGDLLALRSDVFTVKEDWTLQLAGGRLAPPKITLDKDHYTLVDQIEKAFGSGAPSLINCDELKIDGAFLVDKECVFKSTVKLVNKGEGTATLLAGEYQGEVTK